jgi:TPR repeat protein
MLKIILLAGSFIYNLSQRQIYMTSENADKIRYAQGIRNWFQEKGYTLHTTIDGISRIKGDVDKVLYDLLVNDVVPNVSDATESVVLDILGLYFMERRNYTNSMKYYRMAIAKGDNEALNNLANMYQEMVYYYGNTYRAPMMQCYLDAISKGNTNAMVNLALYYEEIKDEAKAIHYYNMAIEKGDSHAMLKLGDYYYKMQKIGFAIKYYVMAIEKENVDAMYAMGKLYQDALSDCINAAKYYTMGMEHGNPNCAYKLGKYAYIGKQTNDAIVYFIRGIACGSKESEAMIEFIIKHHSECSNKVLQGMYNDIKECEMQRKQIAAMTQKMARQSTMISEFQNNETKLKQRIAELEQQVSTLSNPVVKLDIRVEEVAPKSVDEQVSFTVEKPIPDKTDKLTMIRIDKLRNDIISLGRLHVIPPVREEYNFIESLPDTIKELTLPIASQEPTPVAPQEPVQVAFNEPTPVAPPEPAPIAPPEPTQIAPQESAQIAPQESAQATSQEPAPITLIDSTSLAVNREVERACEVTLPEPTQVALPEPTQVTPQKVVQNSEEQTDMNIDEEYVSVTEEMTKN